jgi:hypothetical protein
VLTPQQRHSQQQQQQPQQRQSDVPVKASSAVPNAVVAKSNAFRAMPGNAASNNQSSLSRILDVDNLEMPSQLFNPQDPQVFMQLASKLGLGSHARVEEFPTGVQRGGLNDGVWYISDPELASFGPSKAGISNASGSEQLVLKLVRSHRVASNVPTETENFLKLQRDHPNIVNDPQVAFPCRIYSCIYNGQKQKDLIVMRKARGERLAEFMAKKWYGNEASKRQLMNILKKIGATLREFHSRYSGLQHGDFTPSNIFYDEANDHITFIDNGGMGVPTTVKDVPHFLNSLRLVSRAYGPRLANEGSQLFEQGYAQASQQRVPAFPV